MHHESHLGELFALAAASTDGPLRRDQHTALRTGPRHVARRWSSRIDLPLDDVHASFGRPVDKVVAARLVALPSLEHDIAAALCAGAGSMRRVSYALRTDTAADTAAAYIRDLPRRAVPHLYYALNIATERGLGLGGRPAVVRALVDREPTWAMVALLLTAADAESDQDAVSTACVDRERFVADECPGCQLPAPLPTWFSDALAPDHTCAWSDGDWVRFAPGPVQPTARTHPWWKEPGRTDAYECFARCTELYHTDAGDVLELLSRNRSRPFIHTVEAVRRLTKDPSVDAVLSREYAVHVAAVAC